MKAYLTIANKRDFRAESISRRKERQFIKEHWCFGTPQKYMHLKQGFKIRETKRDRTVRSSKQIHKYTHIPSLMIDRTDEQKISKNIGDLSNTANLMSLVLPEQFI